MPYQLQHAEYQCRAPSDDVISSTAELHKVLKPLRSLPTTCDEVLHLRCEDERGSVPGIKQQKIFAESSLF